MTTFGDAERNFKIYRLVRLLHDLKVICDEELIRHEEYIWSTKPIGLDIDWKRYRIHAEPNEILQF